MDRWEHTADYSEWTIHIREGVVWGDGVPVTAADVKFSMELWADTSVGYHPAHYETITVLDSQSCVSRSGPPRRNDPLNTTGSRCSRSTCWTRSTPR